MALLRESEVRAAARSTTGYLFKSADAILQAEIRNAPMSQNFHIFLCHSIDDMQIVLGTKTILEQMGYSVYVDHQVDPQLDRRYVTRDTADHLRSRMRHCEALFYATSYNSTSSKWMPWELGYFDGYKNKAAILPLVSDYTETDSYAGQEYLGIYPYITRAPARDDTRDRLWVCWSSDLYVSFEEWLQGTEPRQH